MHLPSSFPASHTCTLFAVEWCPYIVVMSTVHSQHEMTHSVSSVPFALDAFGIKLAPNLVNLTVSSSTLTAGKPPKLSELGCWLWVLRSQAAVSLTGLTPCMLQESYALSLGPHAHGICSIELTASSRDFSMGHCDWRYPCGILQEVVHRAIGQHYETVHAHHVGLFVWLFPDHTEHQMSN